jgi:hypothetical protein
MFCPGIELCVDGFGWHPENVTGDGSKKIKKEESSDEVAKLKMRAKKAGQNQKVVGGISFDGDAGVAVGWQYVRRRGTTVCCL